MNTVSMGNSLCDGHCKSDMLMVGYRHHRVKFLTFFQSDILEKDIYVKRRFRCVCDRFFIYFFLF